MAKHPALPQAPLRKRQRAELGRHIDLQPAADLNSLLRGLRFVISALCSPLDAAVSASVFLDSDLHATALVYALILKDGRRSSLIQVNHADEQVAQVGIIQSDDDHASLPDWLRQERHGSVNPIAPREVAETNFWPTHGLGT
jgi:hypothetical protein